MLSEVQESLTIRLLLLLFYFEHVQTDYLSHCDILSGFELELTIVKLFAIVMPNMRFRYTIT
jgi:hypothetical protein